jgi:hypothetical protein
MVRLRRALSGGLFGPLFALGAVAVSGGASRPADVVLAAHALRHPPIIIRHVREGAVEAFNWSGYAVTGAVGSVTDVKGSWTVPAVTCAAGETSYSSFWAGIDGYSSSTVEQTGTDSDCQSGTPTYYAWFEFYPHPLFIINSLTISPGDVISAEVHYNSSTRQFTASLVDETSGQSFSTSTKLRSAQRSSAEWIAEAPSSAGGILPLADFRTAVYGVDNTGVPNTSYATVSGVTHPIGQFDPNSIQTITMVSILDGTTVKAAPSSLSTGILPGTSFSDMWRSAGP